MSWAELIILINVLNFPWAFMIGYSMEFQSEWNYSGLKNGLSQRPSSKMDPITSGLGSKKNATSSVMLAAMSLMVEYVTTFVMFISVIDTGLGLG